jgi:hypothetical protein
VYHSSVALVSVLLGWHATRQYNARELVKIELSSGVPTDASGVPVYSSGDVEWH